MKAIRRHSSLAVLAALIGISMWALPIAQSYVASEPKPVALSEVSIDRNTGDRHYLGHPFTGTASANSAEGQLMKEEQFLDGRRHGHLKRWFPDGTLAFESNYQLGRREGDSKSYWSNGKMRSETHYVDDQPHGVAKIWYRSGEKFKRFNYEHGLPTGLQQAWRLNGKLYSNFEYRNGRTYGLRNSNLCVELNDEELLVGR